MIEVFPLTYGHIHPTCRKKKTVFPLSTLTFLQSWHVFPMNLFPKILVCEGRKGKGNIKYYIHL